MYAFRCKFHEKSLWTMDQNVIFRNNVEFCPQLRQSICYCWQIRLQKSQRFSSILIYHRTLYVTIILFCKFFLFWLVNFKTYITDDILQPCISKIERLSHSKVTLRGKLISAERLYGTLIDHLKIKNKRNWVSLASSAIEISQRLEIFYI